jgi:hypothetical protein
MAASLIGRLDATEIVGLGAMIEMRHSRNGFAAFLGINPASLRACRVASRAAPAAAAWRAGTLLRLAA